jgi:hypothetical protein
MVGTVLSCVIFEARASLSAPVDERTWNMYRRATSTAKDDRMIARGGRHRISEIGNGQNYRRVGSRSVVETNVRVVTSFQLNVSTQTHRARPRMLASHDTNHSRGPKESHKDENVQKRDKATRGI